MNALDLRTWAIYARAMQVITLNPKPLTSLTKSRHGGHAWTCIEKLLESSGLEKGATGEMQQFLTYIHMWNGLLAFSSASSC